MEKKIISNAYILKLKLVSIFQNYHRALKIVNFDNINCFNFQQSILF